MTRVDDQFCQWLKDEGEDFSQLFSFSEVSAGIRSGKYDTDTLPVALKKNQKFGIYNIIFEVDLAATDINWGKDFTVRDMCKLIAKRMKWVRENIRMFAVVFEEPTGDALPEELEAWTAAVRQVMDSNGWSSGSSSSTSIRSGTCRRPASWIASVAELTEFGAASVRKELQWVTPVPA